MTDWKTPYEDALAERDTTKLAAKLQSVEALIVVRLQEISQNNEHLEERVAIQKAITRIRVLQTEKLGYPKI